MKDTLDEAKAALVKSKDEMAKYSDQKRTPGLWITNLKIEYIWMQVTSRQLGLQKSSITEG